MMTSCFDREDETFVVLINREGQYSLWPHWKKVPGGWSIVTDDKGEPVKGDKKHVSSFVDQQWTDMRPLSLQKWMVEQAGSRAAAGPSSTTAGA